MRVFPGIMSSPATGAGYLIPMMLPYSAAFLVCWTALLAAFFSFGIPLGF